MGIYNFDDDELDDNPRADEIRSIRRQISAATGGNPLTDQQMNQDQPQMQPQAAPKMALNPAKDTDFYSYMGLPHGYQSPPQREKAEEDDSSLDDESVPDLKEGETTDTFKGGVNEPQDYAGPTEGDLKKRRDILNEGLGPVSRFLGAFGTKPAQYRKMYIEPRANADLEDKDLLQTIREKQAAFQEKNATRDPSSMRSKLAQLEAHQRLAAISDWGQRNNRPEMVAQADQMRRALAGMNAEDIGQMLGSNPKKTSTFSEDPEQDRQVIGAKTRKLADSDEYKHDLANARTQRLLGTWGHFIQSDPMIRKTSQNIFAAGRSLSAMDDPNLKYTPSLHAELNAGFARALSDRGAVLPVSSEDRIRMTSIMEDTMKKVQYFLNKPMNSIPAGIKAQLKEGLSRLQAYNVSLRQKQVRILGSAYGYEEMPGGEARLNKMLDAYDQASDAYVPKGQEQPQTQSGLEYSDAKKEKMYQDWKAKQGTK